MLNLVDTLNNNNIGGFNISNFKMRYLNEFISDVISDYEQSLIGSFTKSLLELKGAHLDLYLSITKFKNDIGYSLVEGGVDNDATVEHPVDSDN